MRLLLLTLISFAYIAVLHAVEPIHHVEIDHSIAPNPQYDSLVSLMESRKMMESYDRFVKDFITIDSDEITNDPISDSVYAARMQMIASVIRLPFNDVVKRYIHVYTNKRHVDMELMLGRAQHYFPMIENELNINGLPLELKILPIIESALNPKAISHAGAAGMWQMMYKTGKQYGLEVSSFVDDRFDVEKSTKAACLFLKDLYRAFGDWTLTIAAYNCGAGNVTKALKRVPGAKTFWDIYDYLPRETRGYVPSFIAATYAYTFHKAHNMSIKPVILPSAVDTVHLTKMTHFKQISSTINLPIELIRALNPQYKLDIIPSTDKQYTLMLPMENMSDFITCEREIYAKDSLYLHDYLAPVKIHNNASTKTMTSSRTYRIRRGDTLSGLARKYHTTVSAIMRTNRLKSNNSLRIGQVIRIP